MRDEVHFIGEMRVYFNRHSAAPLVWCIAGEAWELAVAFVAIEAPSITVYRPKVTPDDEDGKPSAWIETVGALVVKNGAARIVPIGELGQPNRSFE